MRISVFGSRTLSTEYTKKVLMVWDKIRNKYEGVTYLYGGSKGAQSIILDKERSRKTDCILFKPWSMIDNNIKYRPSMMRNRNIQILDNSDLVIIFDLDDKDNYDWTYEYCEKNNIEYIKVIGGGGE